MRNSAGEAGLPFSHCGDSQPPWLGSFHSDHMLTRGSVAREPFSSRNVPSKRLPTAMTNFLNSLTRGLNVRCDALDPFGFLACAHRGPGPVMLKYTRIPRSVAARTRLS